MSDELDRIAELKRQRGYFAAFGQAQKVKAVDAEIAQLRAQHDAARKPKSRRKPAADVETATADVSSVESAVAGTRSRARRRPPSSGSD